MLYFASPWAVSRPPPSTRLRDNIPASCMHVMHMYNQHRLGRLRLKMALMEALTHRHGPRHHRRDPRDTCCACHIWRLEPFHALQMSCIADFMSRALPCIAAAHLSHGGDYVADRYHLGRDHRGCHASIAMQQLRRST